MGRYLSLAMKAARVVESAEERPVPSSPAPAAPRPSVETGRPQPGALAPCASPHCAGCYEVEPGRKIHPPKCGQDYLDWLLEWEAKGRVQ